MRRRRGVSREGAAQEKSLSVEVVGRIMSGDSNKMQMNVLMTRFCTRWSVSPEHSPLESGGWVLLYVTWTGGPNTAQ